MSLPKCEQIRCIQELRFRTDCKIGGWPKIIRSVIGARFVPVPDTLNDRLHQVHASGRPKRVRKVEIYPEREWICSFKRQISNFVESRPFIVRIHAPPNQNCLSGLPLETADALTKSSFCFFFGVFFSKFDFGDSTGARVGDLGAHDQQTQTGIQRARCPRAFFFPFFLWAKFLSNNWIKFENYSEYDCELQRKMNDEP